MRAVLAYPGLMAHAVQSALALHEAGHLVRFETSFVYWPQDWLGRLLHLGLRLVLGDRAEQELRRRELVALPRRRVRCHPVGEVLRTLAARGGLGPVIVDAVWEQASLRFDREVAAGLSPELDMVLGFEHTCRFTFERAGALGIGRTYLMAAPHYSFSERIVQQETNRFASLRTPYRTRLEQLAPRRHVWKDREIGLADLVVANSRFTARTLIDTGYDPGRIKVVPLAAPPVDPGWRNRDASGPVTFLFAGRASIHKGAHYQLQSWARLNARNSARLHFAGGWDLPDSYARSLPDNVVRLGNLPWPQLAEQYRRASVLVFPSLCDGFGQVVAEALAHGLPVITTSNVGAADLIESGRNGFIVPPADPERLTEVMEWCLTHPDELEAMRPEAEAAAARRPWSVFRAELVQNINDFMRNHGR